MLFESLHSIPYTKQTVDRFLGYDHRTRIEPDRFYEMENLTLDRFPLLSVRKQRGLYAKAEHPGGIIAKDALCYIDGSDLYINRKKIDLGLREGKKQLISMGAYLIILPDKKYINTVDHSDFGNIDARFTAQSGAVFELCKIDGETYSGVVTSDSPPAAPSAGDLWLDSTRGVLMQYSEAGGVFSEVAATYVRISAPGLGAAFSPGDAVTLAGMQADALQALLGNRVIYACGNDHIVVGGMIPTRIAELVPVSVSREMPLMDFVIESGNRLWGCRYGVSASGGVVNEIYASKLGDFKNWHCFEGISTDSYAVSLGSDGVFTGAITHLGYPLFFKENCLYKIYGDSPAHFSLRATTLRGVEKGSENSLAIVGEQLYYKAKGAVMMYDGSLPADISAPLGNRDYYGGVGGSYRGKYYLSLLDAADHSAHLFVYDSRMGLFTREDDLRALGFAEADGVLYCLGEDGSILSFGAGSTANYEGKVSWMAQSGMIGLSLGEKKYIAGVQARLRPALGSEVHFHIAYDADPHFSHVGSVIGKNETGTVTFTLQPRRCDHFRLKICGMGDAELISITLKMRKGE